MEAIVVLQVFGGTPNHVGLLSHCNTTERHRLPGKKGANCLSGVEAGLMKI